MKSSPSTITLRRLVLWGGGLLLAALSCWICYSQFSRSAEQTKHPSSGLQAAADGMRAAGDSQLAMKAEPRADEAPPPAPAQGANAPEPQTPDRTEDIVSATLQTVDANEAPPPRGTPSKADQLANSVEAGDSYATPRGPRRLRRLAGAIALRVPREDQNVVVQKLTVPGAPLEGYTVESEHAGAIVVLKSSDEERQRQMKEPERTARILAAARKAADGRQVDPVFISPETGNRLIATGELIVRVLPEVDPKAYFGPEWKNTRPLAGTPDQFVIAFSNATAEGIFADVERRAQDNRIKWAEPNFLSQVDLHSFDPFYASQWHLNNTSQNGGKTIADVNAPEAWPTTAGSGAIIAILDNGTQTNHPDLEPNLAINAGEIAGNGIDDDGNGWEDDVYGWDFDASHSSGTTASQWSNPNPKTAYDSHGTATAGVAAARGDNGIGVAGIAFTSRLLPIRVLQSNSNGDHLDGAAFSEALYYAAGQTKNGQGRWRGADVISVSLGGFDQSQTIDDALHWAATQGRNGKGCPVFVSSGNGGSGWGTFQLTGIPAGTHTFKWEFVKNGTDILPVGDNTVWLDSIVFPGGAIERFENTTLPSGWTTSTIPWSIVQNGVNGNHSYTGWDGPSSFGVRAGNIGNSQSTYLQVTKSVPSGFLTFHAWYSSEPFDYFNFYYDGVRIFHKSGVPAIPSGVAYPASHPDVIAVGASTDFDYRADYSQYGDKLDFVAPSGGGMGGIYTTDRTGANGYNTGSSAGVNAGVDSNYNADFSGTSSACPLAAGIGALMLSVNQGLTASQLRVLMHNTCDKQVGNVTYDASGKNPYYGYGRVDAAAAVLAASQAIPVTIITPTPMPAGRVGVPYSQTLTATGGVPPYIWSASGTLPNGLQLSASGVLSGAPTTAGPFSFSVTATGSDTATTQKTLGLTILPPNQAPVGADSAVTILDNGLPFTLLVKDFPFSDPNDTPPNNFSGVMVATLPGAGTLRNNGAPVVAAAIVSAADLAAGKLKFTPPPGANGTPYTSFTFRVQDDGIAVGGGANRDPTARTMAINVTSVTLNSALDGVGLTWTTGGAAPWFGQTTMTHDGTDAAISGAIGDNQESWVRTNLSGPGILSFWWKVSSDILDGLRVSVDGRDAGSISKETDWKQITLSLGSGTHTIQWTYVKGVSGSAGQDRGWLDQVSFTAGPTSPVTYVDYRNTDGSRNGSLANPYRNMQEGYTNTGNGGTINIRKGNYAVDFLLNKPGLRLEPRGDGPVRFARSSAGGGSNPIIVFSDPSGGISGPLPLLYALGSQPDGVFELIFSGVPGLHYQLLASPDLYTWDLLQDFVAEDATFSIFDAEAFYFPQRFYKLVLP